MLTGIEATVHHGYTGEDHLIDQADKDAATNAVAGIEFQTALEALEAAEKAYESSCDKRVRSARISVALRNAYGDKIEVG